MRFIKKGVTGGYHLNQAHNNPPTTSEEAKRRWNRFDYKPQVTEFLLDEQYGLCAYSEVRPDQLGLSTHIDHVEPKSAYPTRTFDYANLVLSALSSNDLANIIRNEVFGGHAKLSEYDASLFVSCLRTDCARFFAYLSNGKVEPARDLSQLEQDQAQYTIDLLNLNSGGLKIEAQHFTEVKCCNGKEL